jgi:hypothetical protein
LPPRTCGWPGRCCTTATISVSSTRPPEQPKRL